MYGPLAFWYFVLIIWNLKLRIYPFDRDTSRRATPDRNRVNFESQLRRKAGSIIILAYGTRFATNNMKGGCSSRALGWAGAEYTACWLRVARCQ